MGFRQAILAGVTLIREAIRSPDYVPGVSGWSINRDGTAEFSDTTIRGELIAASGPNDYVKVTPNPVPHIEFSSSNPDQVAPAEIGMSGLGGNDLMMLGPRMGSGFPDLILFETSDTPGFQFLTTWYEGRYEVNSESFDVRFTMSQTMINLVSPVTYVSVSLRARNIRHGTATVPAPGTGGGVSSVSVTFANPNGVNSMTGTPAVTITPSTPANPETTTIRAYVSARSSTGFTIQCYRSTNNTTSFSWVAMSE
jgi:hypothetical protein